MSERHAGGMPPSEHADWVLDLGPGGGVNGGEIVAEAKRERHAGGMPPSAQQEQVAGEPKSFTGQYLRETLAKSPMRSEAEGPKVRKSHKRDQVEQPDIIAAK